MLAVLLLNSSFGADLQVFFDNILSLLNHLHHIFFLSVPFYFFHLPLINLRPQLFNLLCVGLNLFIQLFFTKILFLKLLHQRLVDFLELFTLLQNWVNAITDVFHLALETVGLLFLLENTLKLGLVFGQLFVVLLFHWLDEVEKEFVSLSSIFFLSLKNRLIVANGELDLILKWSNLLFNLIDIGAEGLGLFVFGVATGIAGTGSAFVDFVIHELGWGWGEL